MVKLLVERTIAREGPRCRDHADTYTALKALRSLNACAEINADVSMQVCASLLSVGRQARLHIADRTMPMGKRR